MSASRGRPMPWLWRDDEEMAKKDDDLGAHRRSGHRHAPPAQWQSTRVPRRSVFARRIVYTVIFAVLFFLVYKTVSSTSNSLNASWPSAQSSQESSPGASNPPSKRPANSHDRGAARPRSYNGPVKFPHLGTSLHAIAYTDGHILKNKNVLFATASLQIASALLPMACDMANGQRNFVHFAFIGRSTISMSELLKINGIDSSCAIITHDARPTESGDSTEQRMALASARALFYLNSYTHPQAIIIDASNTEEPYFLSGFRDQIRSIKSALIELPEKSYARLSWLTKLDASSLAAWNSVHFDILVHAPPTGTANLKRLLWSLQRVDLSGMSVPHLTIELPAQLERGTSKILDKFHWPPLLARPFSHPQMLTLNHRLPRHRMTAEERSVRFLESFWPKSPANNHVLILSPQTEITPQFFHYIKYNLLDRLHSSRSFVEPDTRLMAMSFAIPTTFPDATKPFVPPSASNEKKTNAAFLWQAPTSDAVLFLGNKWVELHGLVSQILEKQADMPTTPNLLAKKEVSKKYPAWTEYVLQLARLRGYYTLYPSQEIATSLVGVHTDLSNVPEEFQDEATTKEEEEWITDGHTQKFDPASNLNVFSLLSKSKGDLPYEPLQMLSWDGEQVEVGNLDQKAFKFTQEFRREVGECTEEQVAQPDAPDAYARDLFCKKAE